MGKSVRLVESVNIAGSGRRVSTRGHDEDFARRLSSAAAIVRSEIRRQSRRPSDCEDLFQATMERAWQHRRSYDSTRPIEPWLVQIGRRICIDHSRRGFVWREHPLSLDTLSEHLATTDWLTPCSSDPEISAVQNVMTDIMRDAMRRLPERYRRVLEAHYLDDRPLHVIADAEGATVTAVKPLLQRARAALRSECLSLWAQSGPPTYIT